MVIENQGNDVVSNASSNEVEVTLSYEGNLIKFPINPENLKEVIDSNSTTENIESIGQISIPQRPSLSTISFSSFFWADRDTVNPKEYVRWIKNWQKSRKPARFSVSSIDWDMNVTCESFTHWVNAGEEKDIYFTISLMEYREYGAKQVKLVGNQYILDDNGIQTVVGTATRMNTLTKPNLPVLFTGAKSRTTINKKDAPISVTVGENESILSISSRYSKTGGGWKELYNENKTVFAENLTETIEAVEESREFADMTKAVGVAVKHPITFLQVLLNLTRPFNPPVP